MENKNDYKEEKFNSFLNKTIILSSKNYYKNEVITNLTELKILDNEDYEEYLKKYLQSTNDLLSLKDKKDFIELCENQMLAYALKSLSDIEMTVIFLLFEKQLSSSESSKILKICSDSVTRIKRRALKKIEKYLKGEK